MNGSAEEELAVGVGQKRRRRAWEVDQDAEEVNSEDDKEAKRLADQREKEEFEERLRQKDEARTRKIAEAKLSKEDLKVGEGGQPCNCEQQ